MNSLPKQILNYFATFTETRFNFRRLINYKWTNNELTLDFSLFPRFQAQLLKKIETGDLTPLTISKNQEVISIPKDHTIAKTIQILSKECDSAYLDQCLSQEALNISTEEQGDPEAFEQHKKLAQLEAIRLYNLALRRNFEKALTKLQESLIEQQMSTLRIEHIPPSIFGIANYVNQHFEKIKQFSRSFTDSTSYVETVKKYFKENIDDIVVFDLYYNLQKYNDFTQLGTLFLFFHNLEKSKESFPLYFVEAEIKATSTDIMLSFPRNLTLLNTPAINYFKFDTVLTIPRASSPKQTKSHLGAIESFFQNQYGFQTPFALEPVFDPITHANNEFPQIKSRIGLQTVINEDKKLLDYSELMTKLELGGTSKFSDFIDQYIKGTVPNHQEETDQIFQNTYPLKSPKRYISDGPIPLNNSQKRILLAIANPKNNIIVVDGPPGTGKSHTIAALSYWANEQKKSFVVTSHKKEALDVIDRMLTDKFTSLHPQAKPSIVRMDEETGSSNNLPNTLQTSVINAANERNLNFNGSAFQQDISDVEKRIYSSVEKRLNQNIEYQKHLRDLVELNSLEKDLSNNIQIAAIIAKIPTANQGIDIAVIHDFISILHNSTMTQLSVDDFVFISDHQQQIPNFLEACEKLNQIPSDILEKTSSLKDVSPKFVMYTTELKKYFKPTIKLEKLTIRDTVGGFLPKIFGHGSKESHLQDLLQQLKTLEYSSHVKEIAQFLSIDISALTINDLITGIEKIQFSISLKPYITLISSYQSLPGNTDKNFSQIFEIFKQSSQSPELFTASNTQVIQQLFNQYGPILDLIHITNADLLSMKLLLNPDENASKVWRWIELHSNLSKISENVSLDTQESATYFKLQQKAVENINDQRLKELNNHLGEIARIKVSYEGGKRFSHDEANVLLASVSCIIAEPSTISKYFPMEEGLIDILVIDEASQVSIADSISLILRAKQIVIFGDEYQYGAVSAQNVSAKYSTSYFTEIVSAYADDYQTSISDKAQRELVNEISKEINPDEQVSDTLLKPQEGTVLWLKTFNIRTSTLSFAKAIANYSTSLKEHFRSFPEIIGYSNDTFYKEAQMELLVNRIRTKPIGEVLQFIQVNCQGKSGANVNIDELEAIGDDIKKRIDDGFKGTIGIITSFKEQQARMEQYLNEHFNMPLLLRDHKLAVWFVGDVQGEERDIVYYSFVEDKEINNANLSSIYPVVGGAADSIRSLKMQRLNVGFSRAKDTMVFVFSQPIEKFSNTRLGDALKYYQHAYDANKTNDFFVEDESVFESPMEKKLYTLLLQTQFVTDNREHLKIIPQFDIGKYIAREYSASIPKYRSDFLISYAHGGKEQALILEYDGLEYHFKNPEEVDRMNFSREYIDYDISRQLELESYGYRFLRINKFNLRPTKQGESEKDVLNTLLTERLQ